MHVITMPESSQEWLSQQKDRALLREIAKNLRAICQTLRTSVSLLNVNVHDSPISLPGGVARRKPPLFEKNMATLWFVQLPLSKPQDF